MEEDWASMKSNYSYEHYYPEPANRYPLELEPAGAAIFDNLDDSMKFDLALCIRHKLDIDVQDSYIVDRLAGHEIPVYFADPSLLISDEGRPVRTTDVEKYGKLLADDLLSMPPVIIDSDNIEGPSARAATGRSRPSSKAFPASTLSTWRRST